MRSTESSYRPDIDGLRALAVLAVVGYHAFPDAVPGGFAGVDVFFVISGYLITGIIARAIASDRFSLADFYRRRARRIFPALVLVLVATLVMGWLLLRPEAYANLSMQTIAGGLFSANIWFWLKTGYFDPAAEMKPLLHLWSLGVEEQFYLVWPLLLMLLALLRPRARALAWLFAVTAVALLSFGLNLVMTDHHSVDAFYLPYARFWEPLAGASLALWEMRHPAAVSRGPSRMKSALSLAGLLLIVSAIALLAKSMEYPGWRAGLPVLGAVLLIAAGPGSLAARYVLSRRLMVGIGLISYPLYLWHWPLLVMLREYELGQAAPLLRGLTVLLALALAWLTYRLLESRVQRGALRVMAARSAVALLVVITAAVAIRAADGVESRLTLRMERKAFIAGYEDLHHYGLQEKYRVECDFYDWDTMGARDEIDSDCLERGSRGTLLLWGDSHAQALSYGLRSSLPAGYALAQVATSGCKPGVGDNPALAGPGVPVEACLRSNRLALATVRRIRPRAVILAQAEKHDVADWQALTDKILAAGVRDIYIVGPVPQWRPSLPEVYARYSWNQLPARLATGLDQAIFRWNAGLLATHFSSSRVHVVSLLDRLCDHRGCVWQVPAGKAGNTLLAVDYGHLSPAGSLLVGGMLVQEILGENAGMPAEQ